MIKLNSLEALYHKRFSLNIVQHIYTLLIVHKRTFVARIYGTGF